MLKIEPKKPQFIGHNIRLDDGRLTMPGQELLEENERIVHLKSVLNKYLPERKSSIVDLGCFEGGISVVIARMGYSVLGLEIRQSNINACKYVKTQVDLPNLSFTQDVVTNITKYGDFDAIICYGILYHLDRPKSFLQTMSQLAKKMIVIDTHFSIQEEIQTAWNISRLTENEGLRGRWYQEFDPHTSYERREERRGASWDNHKSFWILQEELVKTIEDVGFSLVEEKINKNKAALRGTFVCLK